MDQDPDDLGQAVAGFRRAEVALAAIAADADRLVDARSEVEQARNELKVVAGALVGLATAHRDLVGQLGEAAAALRPVERREDERLTVALRESDVVRSRQVSEVADAVEELAHRLDRALNERITVAVDQMHESVGPLARADQVAALGVRLDQVADRTTGPSDPDDFPWLLERLDTIDRMSGGEQLAAIQDLLTTLAATSVQARLDEVVTSAELEAMERRLVETLSTSKALPAGSPVDEGLAEEVAERAANAAAEAIEEQVAELIGQVHAGQRRVHQMVLAVGVAFLVFAAVISALALR